MNRENGSAKRQIWIVGGEGALSILETAMEFRRIDPFKGTESISANMAHPFSGGGIQAALLCGRIAEGMKRLPEGL